MKSPINPQVEAVIPGVYEAYDALRSDHGYGLYTSMGELFNHTIFGRDSAMTAKFMTDVDHQVAREAIFTLASLQGVGTNPVTQEEPGRIHHEFRDFHRWEANALTRLVFLPWKYLWGGTSDQLLTYFAADTTAGYIRLVHKYATHIDASILSRTVVDRHGTMITIADTVARAAVWLQTKITREGLFKTTRTNGWSLPYQTYQDSLTSYSWSDGRLANYRKSVGYIEAQAFAADALRDAVHLLPDHQRTKSWSSDSGRLWDALLGWYWREDEKYFSGCIDARGVVDRRFITPGWTLNTGLWETMDEAAAARRIRAIVTKLFSAEFLTDYGLRTRSYGETLILPGVAEYHGSMTIWPMFNFMVIEGLRRHRMYRLAAQLEHRILNGLNSTKHFDEFLLVNRAGTLLLDKPGYARLDVQMKPERDIAFSVIPALVLAERSIQKANQPPPKKWQATLEATVLSTITDIPLYPADEALRRASVEYRTLKRGRAARRSVVYFLKQRKYL